MFFSPFGDMPGHGGAPQRKPVDNTKLYEILGVEKDATQAQIKKAFRKGAMKHHPDKGGDPEMVRNVVQDGKVCDCSGSHIHPLCTVQTNEQGLRDSQ